MILVDTLKRRGNLPWTFMVSWQKLLRLLTQLEWWEVSFCRHMANRAADLLAKLNYTINHTFPFPYLRTFKKSICKNWREIRFIITYGLAWEPGTLGMLWLCRLPGQEILLSLMLQSAVRLSLICCFGFTLEMLVAILFMFKQNLLFSSKKGKKKSSGLLRVTC